MRAQSQSNLKTTVLMFGWEFPPHISGGLGTACYGLSKALLKKGVGLLFVVPTSGKGSEIPLIDASTIELTEVADDQSAEVDPVRTVSDRKISVTSTLRPYTDPLQQYAEDLSKWSYTISDQETPGARRVTRRYSFAGGYGPDLMEEVFRFGEVATAIAAENSFDIIHAHDWLTYPAGIEAKRVSGKPFVIHVHATEFDRAGTDHINSTVYEIEQQGMLAADKIVAVSHWTRDIIVSKYGIDPAKVVVIHNGVIPQERSTNEEMPTISDFVITFLGRITFQKGPQYFIEAANKVLQLFPETHFVMAGSGDLLPAMIELTAKLKISPRFHFTGFLKAPQVAQLWSITDVYVMPSVSEPFGITPLEAAQAGVPVIISKQSGVSEVMQHAIKVDFWNTDALASAMIGLLRHRSLATTLSKHGQNEIDKISWERTAQELIKVYDQLI